MARLRKFALALAVFAAALVTTLSFPRAQTPALALDGDDLQPPEIVAVGFEPDAERAAAEMGAAREAAGGDVGWLRGFCSGRRNPIPDNTMYVVFRAPDDWSSYGMHVTYGEDRELVFTTGESNMGSSGYRYSADDDCIGIGWFGFSDSEVRDAGREIPEGGTLIPNIGSFPGPYEGQGCGNILRAGTYEITMWPYRLGFEEAKAQGKTTSNTIVITGLTLSDPDGSWDYSEVPGAVSNIPGPSDSTVFCQDGKEFALPRYEARSESPLASGKALNGWEVDGNTLSPGESMRMSGGSYATATPTLGDAVTLDVSGTDPLYPLPGDAALNFSEDCLSAIDYPMAVMPRPLAADGTYTVGLTPDGRLPELPVLMSRTFRLTDNGNHECVSTSPHAFTGWYAREAGSYRLWQEGDSPAAGTVLHPLMGDVSWNWNAESTWFFYGDQASCELTASIDRSAPAGSGAPDLQVSSAASQLFDAFVEHDLRDPVDKYTYDEGSTGLYNISFEPSCSPDSVDVSVSGTRCTLTFTATKEVFRDSLTANLPSYGGLWTSHGMYENDPATGRKAASITVTGHKPVTVNVSPGPEAGSVAYTPEKTECCAYEEFTVSANPGWRFSGWVDETGKDCGSDPKSPSYFDADRIYTAVFEKLATSRRLYRLYNRSSGEHLYTIRVEEVENCKRNGWVDETGSSDFMVPSKSDEPVYRLYNPNTGAHLYTVDSYEVHVLSGLGWRNEDVAFYSGTGQPMYRLFNPNAEPGGMPCAAHHYTTDTSECWILVGRGYQENGVAWRSMA